MLLILFQILLFLSASALLAAWLVAEVQGQKLVQGISSRAVTALWPFWLRQRDQRIHKALIVFIAAAMLSVAATSVVTNLEYRATQLLRSS